MHIHLDIVGGIAGDMFCSAMLDAFPELERPLYNFLSSLPVFQKYHIQLNEKQQKEIMGKQFIILKKSQSGDYKSITDTDHLIFRPLTHRPHSLIKNTVLADHPHEHYSWGDIQEKLKQLVAHKDIYQCAKEIYTILATAESEIHGIELNNISLHEVGSDDAIIDIVSAAFLICQSHVSSWSCSSLPWGQGIIKCAHGELPVPAPATLKILTGFEWFQDNEMGERITPTGAAILAWIMKYHSGKLAGVFFKNGYGCGNRQFEHKPNILRLNVFNDSQSQENLEQDSIYMIQCDIDDMTQESLAISQERLRQHIGVIDLTSQNIMGKKGRWMTRLEILCAQENLTKICNSLLIETSTLGVRYWKSERFKLFREQITVHSQQTDWPIKVAVRQNGCVTAKLESDFVQTLQQTHSEREKVRYEIEQLAINKYLVLRKRENHE